MPGRAQLESANRVSDCITDLLKDQPFFGSLALRLPIRADNGRSTLASDGHEIRYSPAWVAETGADYIKTAIARVVLACALKHHTRRGERDPERWQHASQLVTHGLLQDAGFSLPPDAEAWDGLSVEEAYNRLPEPQQDDSPPPPGAEKPDSSAPPEQDGSEQDEQPSPGPAGNEPDDDNTDPSDPGDDEDTPQPPHSDQPADTGGTGSDSQPDDDTDQHQSGDAHQSFDPAGTGEIMDSSSAGPAGGSASPSQPQIDEQEQAWDEAMHQALNLAKAQGKVPGGVQETIEDAHTSTFDWRTLLRLYMTDAAASDYSWSVPNRRFIDSGLYLPSIRSQGIDCIAVIVDSSASVETDTLAEFWSEIRELATEIDPQRIILLQVDSALQDEQDYAPTELPDRIDIKGRYGTDFRPGFARLDEIGAEPAVCLYFTDMECDDYPDEEPPYPVIWCDYGDGLGLAAEDPPWGERIKIAD